MNTNEIYRLIEHEKLRAENLHKWPRDIIHAVAVVGEESGESTQAALNYLYHGNDKEKIRTEIIQTAATCIRFLENWDNYNECLP
jgi:hypothetical protein